MKLKMKNYWGKKKKKPTHSQRGRDKVRVCDASKGAGEGKGLHASNMSMKS